jgi:hypothetical protein
VVIDGTPIAPVLIDMKAGEIVYPNGQSAGFKKIAIPANIRAIRSRRAYQLWRETREKGYRMPVDCGLAERNAAYLFRTTSLSPAQCDRMGLVMAAYLVEVLI